MSVTPREAIELRIEPGPHWSSFEQFRLSGVDGLRQALGPKQVGRLNVKGEEFVIMHSESFTRLHGAAQEASHLRRQLRLIQQAVQLIDETHGSQMAIEHLSDLTDQVPGLEMQFGAGELVFDDDERAQSTDYAPEDHEFELDPTRVRSTWNRG